MLLLVFLLEATVAILFFAYTDKVRPPVPTHPHHQARGCDTAGDDRVGGLGTAVTDAALGVDNCSPVIWLTGAQGRGLGFNHRARGQVRGTGQRPRVLPAAVPGWIGSLPTPFGRWFAPARAR